MCLLCVFLCLLLIRVHGEIIDCIEGETWYEECSKCTCLRKGKFTCLQHLQSCNLDECIENIIVFKSNFRCHCTKNKATVCVALSYQGDLEGKPCAKDSYYYDNCTFCKCDENSKRTKCEPIVNCNLTNGGICNSDETVMEKCYRCSCSHSKFRICSLLKDCSTGKEKPGKCHFVERYYPRYLQNYCISMLHQECYSDYGCPGVKKCCRIVDCYLRCVDPV